MTIEEQIESLQRDIQAVNRRIDRILMRDRKDNYAAVHSYLIGNPIAILH